MNEIFTEAERAAWFPLEKLKPSDWANRYRKLSPHVAAESGDYSTNRTPYIIGIIDCFSEIGVEEIIFLKPAQVGWTTALETLSGWAIDNNPGPILLVLPDEKTAKDVISERIRPMIEHTPAVQRHLSNSPQDDKLTGIKFDTCTLHVGWAGSASSLSSRAIQFLLFDEVDKFPPYSGKEAEPISLGVERTTTYKYRRRILLGSTPTSRSGTIFKAYESAGDKRSYFVPCPHCSEFQILAFTQIKYPKLSETDNHKYADEIEQNDLAYYECSHCKGTIREQHKTKMLLKGVWLSEGQTIDKLGNITGNRPKSKRVAFWLNGLYSPWRTFSGIAAEHRRSIGDIGRMQNFKNSILGEPFEEVIRSTSVDDFRKIAVDSPPALIVPKWAQYIIAAADVHKELGKGIVWNVRAWGAGYKSQLITTGHAFNFEELRQRVLDTQFILEAGGTSRVHILLVDAGWEPEKVYDFSKSDERIHCVKGDADNQTVLVKRSVEVGKHQHVKMWTLNTQLLKDRLARLRQEPGRWMLNDRVTEQYLTELASEHKIWDRKRNRDWWDKRSKGAANEALDIEVYSVAGAEVCRVDLLLPEQSGGENNINIPGLDQNLSVVHSQHSQHTQETVKQEQTNQYIQPRRIASNWLGGSSGKSGGWLNR